MGITEDMQPDFRCFSLLCKYFCQIVATHDDETDVESTRLKIESCGVTQPAERVAFWFKAQ